MKFEIPSDISGLDREALAALIAKAIEALDVDFDKLTDEELVEAEAISGFIQQGNDRIVEIGQQEEQRTDRINAIKEAAKSKAPEVKKAEPAKAPEAKKEETPAAKEVVTEAERIAAEAAEQRKVPEPVTAGGGSIADAAAAATAGKGGGNEPDAPRKPLSSLVAAAGVPGYDAGHKFETLEDGADAILRRLRQLPDGQRNMFVQNSALQIQLPKNDFAQNAEMFASKPSDFALIEAASKLARNTKIEALTAAGGWGAPSERSLDFCELESIEGLLQIPEITITRGGIQYTKGPDFASVLGNSTGFWDMTEATAEAGVELKTSLRPAVPPFIEKRLDAVGVMMEAGLLLREGWPELVARYANLLLKAHQYKLAQKTMAQMLTLIGAATNITGGFGNALDFLHVVELVALGERQRLLLGQNTVLEVIAPSWAKAVIRADLAQRSGVDTISVTDAQIDAHFTARKTRVQWIQGWQNLVLTGGVATTYPDTLEILMYPAGTFVRGVTDVIQLDTIYDSVNLKKNDYVHLFVEQGTLVANPCGDGRRISFPFLGTGRRAGVSDAAGTAGQNDSLFNAAVANT